MFTTYRKSIAGIPPGSKWRQFAFSPFGSIGPVYFESTGHCTAATVRNNLTRNSSEDEIANVNFLYDETLKVQGLLRKGEDL